MTGFLVWPFLRRNGPAKSIPATENAGLGVTRLARSWRIYWVSSLAATCRHTTHLLQTVLASLLANSTCALEPAEERRREGPQWARVTCKDKNKRRVNMSLLERIGGCCCDREREMNLSGDLLLKGGHHLQELGSVI